ncbi:MAG: SHOCT domain-containing protein [Gammaproteobacteria bacterium]|nr:SHOCT domain-containing protein [Gammaproteobacteria bacterium]NNM00835.1 SHOCT domain-containing protein [Gammaproteobacteria bacterium]
MHIRTLIFAPALAVVLLAGASLPAGAIDLIPDFLEKKKDADIGAVLWELNEQFVRLESQDELPGGVTPPNDHPVEIDPVALGNAFASVIMWESGGFFRDEQTSTLFAASQAELLGRYVAEGLAKAAPGEDVTFNSRSYASVLLDVAKERQWTTGRVFYRDGKVNLILGEFRKTVSKDKRGAEASFGILEEDWRDVNFAKARRSKQGSFKGRIAETDGIALNQDAKGRGDWILIDVTSASESYVASQTPNEIREQQRRAEEETARLTMERREMREEMARLKKQINDLSKGGGGSASLEERLTTLGTLKDKGLITDDEYQQRRREILQDI